MPAPRLHETAHAPAGRVPAKLTHVAKPVPEPKKAFQIARHQPAPIERRDPGPAHREPGPAPAAAPALPDIQVTHDRKHHYSADPASEADAEPRKATATDFMTPFSAPVASTPASPAPVLAPRPIAAKAQSAQIDLPSPANPPAPSIVPVLYDKRGHLIVPPALKGSHEILVRQNEMADHDHLDRIQDDADLLRLRETKLLVPVPAVAGLQLDERLPLNRRYCRPWTAQFLAALARAHYAKFHSPLQVNSAVRTVAFQERLIQTNGNAAPAEGETASPHLTGQAVDLAKRGLSLTEIAWLRGYLLPLVQAGKVDVEEEFQQACFHISVYRKYLPQPVGPREIAPVHHVSGAALATAIR